MEEFKEEDNEENIIETKKVKESIQNKWVKDKLEQLHTCQNNLFGINEIIPKRMYNLRNKIQEKIVKYYIDRNSDCGKSADFYKKTPSKLRRELTRDILVFFV